MTNGIKRSGPPVLRVRDLRVSFKGTHGDVDAVRGISFDIWREETLAIIGESGCGKTVTCKSILKLIPDAIFRGSVEFAGRNIFDLDERGLGEYRGRKIAMVFQDPSRALNPWRTIGRQLVDVIKLHHSVSKSEAQEFAGELLAQVLIDAPKRRMTEYPHQQSGGINQRVTIAMALACNPEILIADEPTSSLDPTIQSQVIEILKGLKNNLSILLVSHDLAAVRELSDRALVMYQGYIMEEGAIDTIFENPKHPYTKALIGSSPLFGRGRIVLSGDANRSTIASMGCPFAPRCPEKNKVREKDFCNTVLPPLWECPNPVRCHLYDEELGAEEH